MIQQPRIPSSGLMPASDVLIRAKEVSLHIFFSILQFLLLQMTKSFVPQMVMVVRQSACNTD